jgi:hypothetical protein
MPHRASRFLVGLCVAACLVAGRTADVWAAERPSAVAVFPVENLSGVNVPADVIRQVLTERLAASGITVLDDETLDAFVVRHRVRYAAGVDAATAALLHKETGVEGRRHRLRGRWATWCRRIAAVVRLVSTTSADSRVGRRCSLSGDDAPGLLDLRMVNDYDELVDRALDRLQFAARLPGDRAGAHRREARGEVPAQGGVQRRAPRGREGPFDCRAPVLQRERAAKRRRNAGVALHAAPVVDWRLPRDRHRRGQAAVAAGG